MSKRLGRRWTWEVGKGGGGERGRGREVYTEPEAGFEHVMDRERERMRGKNRRLIDLDGLTYQPQSWRATERMEWLNRAREKMNERKKTSTKKKKKKNQKERS